VVARANGGQHGGFGQGERDQRLHDAQDELGAAGDVELPEQPVQMHVNRVGRNSESLGNLGFVLIIEDGLNDLQLPLRDVQSAGDFKPGVGAEERRSPELGGREWMKFGHYVSRDRNLRVSWQAALNSH